MRQPQPGHRRQRLQTPRRNVAQIQRHHRKSSRAQDQIAGAHGLAHRVIDDRRTRQLHGQRRPTDPEHPGEIEPGFRRRSRIEPIERIDERHDLPLARRRRQGDSSTRVRPDDRHADELRHRPHPPSAAQRPVEFGDPGRDDAAARRCGRASVLPNFCCCSRDSRSWTAGEDIFALLSPQGEGKYRAGRSMAIKRRSHDLPPSQACQTEPLLGMTDERCSVSSRLLRSPVRVFVAAHQPADRTPARGRPAWPAP